MMSMLVADSLQSYLQARLPNADATIFADGHALSSERSRIELAFALGLIDLETKQDLDIIREIRNAAAHGATYFSLENGEIIDVCKHFQMRMTGNFNGPTRFSGIKVSETKARFGQICTFTAMTMSHRAKLPPGPLDAPSTSPEEQLQ